MDGTGTERRATLEPPQVAPGLHVLRTILPQLHDRAPIDKRTRTTPERAQLTNASGMNAVLKRSVPQGQTLARIDICTPTLAGCALVGTPRSRLMAVSACQI